MTDVAIWLLRWTIAGAALSTIVIGAAYVLERKGCAVSLHLYRVSLLAALVAPIIALAPPALTFSATPPAFVEADRSGPRMVERPLVERSEASAPAAQDRNRGKSGGVSPDTFAIALIGLWIAGVAFASRLRQRSASQLSRAFRGGAPYPTSFVECRLSANIQTPLVFGVLRPRMLAPADFPEWSPAERDAVMRHEASHLRRGDLVWAALGDAVSVLYWWMPPVTALARQHLLVTEEACDAASLGGGEDRHGYARTLLAITRRVGGHAAPGLAATGPSLRRRIESLISPRRNAFALTAPVAVLAAAGCIVLALSGPAAAQGDGIRIYILVHADGASSTYALSDGNLATAAVVQNCVGRLAPNAAALVDQLEARIHNGEEDELRPVTVIGPGSRVDLGSCPPNQPRDEADEGEDALVLVVDASENQARRLVRQIDALSRSDQRQMLAELALSDRR